MEVIKGDIVHGGFYGDGSLYYRVETLHDNWTKHGFAQLFHDNGQLELEGYYRNNLRFGLWKRWFSDGREDVIRYYIT